MYMAPTNNELHLPDLELTDVEVEFNLRPVLSESKDWSTGDEVFSLRAVMRHIGKSLFLFFGIHQLQIVWIAEKRVIIVEIEKANLT